MANRIVYNYNSMTTAYNQIIQAANAYAQAANALKTALNNSTLTWEGLSKNKFDILINSVTTYLSTDVPEIVRGIAALVDNSGTVMAQTDEEIAGHIPDSI